MTRGPRRRRTLKELLFRSPGSPFELFLEYRHPLVRAEFRRTRKARRVQAAFLVGTPLAALLASLLLMPLEPVLTAVTASWFAALWPAVLMTGAALATAGAINEEMEQETALQLVLTPLPARPLTAAKVLPRLMPFVLGAAAAVPVCVLACACECFLGDGSAPTPLLVWPCRMLAVFFPANVVGFSLLSAGAAAVAMCCTDVLLVWLAALGGVRVAIRHRRRLRTVMALPVLLGRLALLSLLATILGSALVSAVGLPLIYAVDNPAFARAAAAFLTIPIGTTAFMLAMWGLALNRASLAALGAMQAFDRLANEEYGFPLGT